MKKIRYHGVHVRKEVNCAACNESIGRGAWAAEAAAKAAWAAEEAAWAAAEADEIKTKCSAFVLKRLKNKKPL